LLSFEPLFKEKTAHSFMDEKGKKDFEALFKPVSPGSKNLIILSSLF